jgi:biopolymer transport protein ExbD
VNDFYKGSAASEAGYLKNKRSKRRVALRMTAMIDVIFLLLIFFVLTAKFREPEQFLDMALAEEKGNIDVSLAVVEPLVIKINGSRGEWLIIVGGQEEFAFSGKRLDDAMEKLGVVIENVLDKQKRRANDPVKIVCGDRVKWAVLARVYNLLYQTGMSDITFVIE